MQEGNAILVERFENAHYMWVAKCNIGIMTLNPHYLWKAKMLNPYISNMEHFSWNLMTVLKPSKEIDFLKLGKKK
jgi:hypothetical protein